MGEVYRAVDTALGRSVAIKLLPAETVATSERRRRFEAEAKSAASVSHPNLVPVYDVGEAAGVPYIVQEFVEGETLDRVLNRDGVVPVEKAAEWGLQAAEGLAAAHDAGILHRDVKPGNLILGNDGRLRVLDFGLAKMIHPSSDRPGQTQVLTNDGIVVGTVHYMSPEQTVKRPLDARSDVFSLGIVLYELATGERPFDGESAVDVMHAVAYDPPTPIEKVAPNLPAPFVAIVEKALEKRPDDRYQSIREMAVDLRRYLRKSSGHPSTMRGLSSISKTEPVPPVPEPPAPPEPRRAAAIGLGAFVLLALLGLGVGLLRGRPREPHPPSATRILIQSESREEAPVFSPDGRAFAYASNERGNFDIYYRLVAGGSSVRLTDDADDERDPVFTPEGTSIYFVRGD
ncbi:MAG TPA: protein kinase, partial [Thermoanaerobaculia bacterium]|nr:protein kinase [Thermoanaerobaculia bacterium]